MTAAPLAPEMDLNTNRHEALAPGEFSGDLDCLSPFELLQTLHYLRKRGILRIDCASPGRGRLEAELAVARAGVIRASCGHLEGREAILATADWGQGRFSFSTRATTEIQIERPGVKAERVAPPQPIPDLLLHAAWLADEVEARPGGLPTREVGLDRRGGAPPPALAKVPGATSIWQAIERRPGLTREQIEETLPFAPLTLSYALGRLLDEGHVIPRSAATPIHGLGRLASRDGRAGEGGSLRRALVAFAPGHGELALEMLHQLALELTGCEENSFFDPMGVSFLRLRVSPVRTLSITVLPILRRNRFLFESLLPPARAVAFLSDEADHPEAASWLLQVPPSCTTIQARDVSTAVSSLRGALERDEA